MNISKTIELDWQGRSVRTSIFKKPVDDAVFISEDGLTGDSQTDRIHHGGEFMAVYMYFEEHYHYWQNILKQNSLPFGKFGENLTVSGLNEEQVSLGDRLRVGEVLLEAVQFRTPCYKLGIVFEDQMFIKKFAAAIRPGVYFRVAETGYVKTGDSLKFEFRDPDKISIKEMLNFESVDVVNSERLKLAIAKQMLPPKLKKTYESILDSL